MKERWQQLEATLDHLDRHIAGRVEPSRLLELGALYQETLSDLGRARTTGDERLQRYLNRLVARAYSHIYRRNGDSILLNGLDFILRRFPALVLERGHFIMTAFLIFLFSSVIGFLCVSADSKLIDLVIPESMRSAISADLAHGKISRDMTDESRLQVSSFIMTNNIKVSFNAFAFGFLFGIGTIYIMIYNGLLLGGLASVYHDAGQAVAFWSLILPHGVIELPCCFIAGGAGLILGYALVDPGRHERFDWLAHEGRAAAKLVAGVVPMLVLAALVETWVTPSTLPVPVKYLIAAVLLLATVVYLTWPALAQSLERSFRRR